MKTALTILLFTLFSASIYAQIDLDEIVSEFMTENKLSYEKLEKLESIRVQYGHESKQWKSAYKKWDKKKVTDSIFIEQFALRRKDFRSKDLYTSIGYPKESILRSAQRLNERGKLNDTSMLFVKSVVYRTVNNEEIIRSDVRLVSEHYQSYTSRFDTIREIAEFTDHLHRGASIDSLNGLVEAINSFDDQTLLNLKEYLRGKGYDQLDRRIIPELTLRKRHYRLTTMFKSYMRNSVSCIRWDEDVVLMFEPYYSDSAIRNVLIAHALLDRLREFNIDQLNNSATGRKIKESTTYEASTLLFGLVQHLDFQLERYPILESDESNVKRLINLAYNDIYFVHDVDYDKANETIQKLDFSTFDLSENERKLIDALQISDVSKRQERLKESIVNIEFEGVEEFSVFKLAVYGAIAQTGFAQSTNWNEKSIIKSLFENESTQIVKSKALSDEWMAMVASEMFRINKEVYFNVDKVILTVNHKGEYNVYPTIRFDLREEIRRTLDKLNNRVDFPKYTRWVINFNQKEEEIEEIYEEEVYEEELKFDPAPSIPPATIDTVIAVPLPEPIDFPDMDASFPGGAKAMKTWIENNLQYPEISIELQDEGRVYVRFVVEIDGSISNVQVMRGGLTPELNREAKRLIRSMPKWKAGELKGNKVRTNCRIPIVFSLDEQN